MNGPAHTPYDGSSKPFTIGLKPLGLDEWIDVDECLLPHLAEKRRLYAEIPEKVFVEEDGTREAQREVLDLLAAYLAAKHPGTHRDGGSGAAVIGDENGGGPTAALRAAPLVQASLLVQEDLILMRRDESGWRLAAGSLCFPSSWSLLEKFGKPLQQIHAPVPGFGPGTRPAELINRMFDGLQGQAVERYNWSIQAGDALYHPLSNLQRIDRATNRPTRFADGDIDAHAFIRVERQTLRKLPVSRDILFTIRIHLDPLKVLARHPDRATLAASFAAQLEALDEAQLDYKGLTADRDRLVAFLADMATAA
ncbi:DUF3445 domain-containing protein [Mesorhizobium sp. M4A.F.Ca.ET.020.02.1.1]|uniref:heme-dependent oxidative N-demethylase family protein n=1 Tax=unclassified Mesorhizobium TaxID=325217 RepID=UPI000FCB2C35|nr:MULTISPECIES: DUF3445 domain-containing protein [unclassified Mesorhizobium]RVD70166.1 DUF3445 domain-containing protein [Mesorhizobium sp. M4A.F.Ca.ET.029.04.2.1]RVC74501.1 DUF3445 domain-containing protein [Mesorhizobium sp. M4A.F.Ca.ET.022.05.2.1]RVD41250.1 DUF3445 domain-containing protein [Mesorhizobium sp. M4A.F.Ca.ET.020.02.1.1]RWC15215.1 MAG: DUF3445 domain-containing protein [Mesorhizobium sp.]RWD24201.1 MAG: DUF3445 domain-containing protein [Mesorhizobium sp.]